MGRNTVSISIKALLAYLWIPAKVIELEKVALSDMQNLEKVC